MVLIIVMMMVDCVIGFDVIETPAHVHEKLKKAFDNALLNWNNIRDEAIIDVLYTPIPSKFISLFGLDREVHLDLLPLHEEWAGKEKQLLLYLYILYFIML